MKAEELVNNLDSLLAPDSVVVEEGRNSISKSPRHIIPHENERFLAAWVLLTRFPQEQLDRAWEKNGNQLSYFAGSLLNNIYDVDVFENDHPTSNTGGCNIFLYTCYVRLVAQVTARLTTLPSKELRHQLYNSWKRMSTLIVAMDKAETSSGTVKAKLQNSTIIALSVDVYNAFVAWMDQDISFFSSDSVMQDIWDLSIAAYTPITRSAPELEQENGEKQYDSTTFGVGPKFQSNERKVMLNVLESLLGRPSEAEKIGSDEFGGDIYTIRNVQRLIFVIFELQGIECASDEFVSSILVWSIQSNQDESFDPDLRILRDGWLMKNIRNCISRRPNDTDLLRDPEMMDAMQKITLAHVVSPNAHALRPMAWQTISEIMIYYGWSWIQKSSIKNSICTWCRIACGEWKIQLEGDGNSLSQGSTRLSILDGCGKLLITIVQYLVDFDECPYKSIPLGMESILSIRQALEDTLSLTSTYLYTFPCASDDIESAIMINLWSELLSETQLSTAEAASNVMPCLGKLLLFSSDESLVRAVVHVISTHSSKKQFLLEDFDNSIIHSCIVYLQRFWKNLTKPDFLEKWYSHDIIRSACVATEMLAEHGPEKLQEVSNAIFAATDFLLESLNMRVANQRNKLIQSLQLVVDSCIMLLEQFGETFATKNRSYTVSSAIEILKEK